MELGERLRNEFWENDKKNGGHIKSQYDEIKMVFESNDIDWVMEKLRRIKLHAVAHTEFYKGLDRNDVFPVVNKSIITENRQMFIADKGYKEPLHTSSTSGSTGIPFSVIQDIMKRKRTIADLQFFGELADYPSHERMIFFRALNTEHRRSPEQEEKENIFYIDSSDLGLEGLKKMIGSVVEKKPMCILSYSSTIVELARYVDKLETKLEFPYINSIITIGEGLSEENKELIERVFSCKVFRRYSNMELGILAQDGKYGKDYILNYGSYYFECLKIDSDEPIHDGEVGRIVVTDLFNYAMPMIRYDTGDLGIFDTSGKVPVLKEIYGRQRDCVYSVSGNLISPAKISVSMWGMADIKQWQFIQKTKIGYVLRLNSIGKVDETYMTRHLKDILGESADIKIEYVDEIPCLSSQKRRAVICEYNKEGEK